MSGWLGGGLVDVRRRRRGWMDGCEVDGMGWSGEREGGR